MFVSGCLAALTLALAGMPPASVGTPLVAMTPLSPQDLTLEQIYRSKPYGGQTARSVDFSHDARFLAFLWNPYGERGSDLYVYDTTTGQTRRVTSMEFFKAYEAPETLEKYQKKSAQLEKEYAEAQEKVEAQAAYLKGAKVDLGRWEAAAIEALKKEDAEKKAKEAAEKKKAEAEKAKEAEAEKAKDTTGKAKAETEKVGKDATTAKDAKDTKDVKDAKDGKAAEKTDKDKDKEKELWEWRDELKTKREKEKIKGGDLYPGVSTFTWAHKADELIFQYRGTLFRFWAETGKVERLSSSDRPSFVTGYTADDQGYYYMDGTSILEASFQHGGVRQINRALVFPDDADKKYTIQGTTLSEKGDWMALHAELVDSDNPGGHQERQVQIMDYTKRFAESRRVSREVPDDKRNVPPMALYIRKVSDEPVRQPEPVITFPGGDVWFEMSPLVWSKDSSHYTFATWEREKDLLKVYVGKASETEKPEVVLERKGNVGHEVVDSMAPCFTPDSKTLVVVLDESGFRQPYVMDLATKALRPVLKGAFEAHSIQGFSADSKHMFLISTKEDTAAPNLFQVDLATGAMKPLGLTGRNHRGVAISEDGTKAAFNAGNWQHRTELFVEDVAKPAPKVLTDSHDKAWARVNVLCPERFHFTNRHGDRIEGYMFKPKGWKASDKRPAVIYTYGGPLGDSHMVEVDSFQPTAYLFGMYMAVKHGYVMVTVDPRGNSNYGRSFSDANFEHPGKPQTEDFEDLVAWLGKGMGVDTHRVGLTGWSFGGFQTQYSLYTSPDTFACGIAGAGPTEWENYNSWYSGRTIGKAEHGKPNLRKFSLIPLAQNLKKPLLLVHGMVDDNVLYQDTVNVYRALLQSGKESLVDLFLDPEGTHGLGGAIKNVGWHKKFETFFLQHLGKAK